MTYEEKLLSRDDGHPWVENIELSPMVHARGGGGCKIATEAKRPWAKRPGGKTRLAEEMVWGETTRILEGT